MLGWSHCTVSLTQHWIKCLGAKGSWLLSPVGLDEGGVTPAPLYFRRLKRVPRVIFSISLLEKAAVALERPA